MCVFMVVASDDSALLATFAQWAVQNHVLQWSSKLLVLTQLPLVKLRGLHKLLSMNNAVLGIMNREANMKR